jgi:cyclic beta-1,2-glucan synthetase
MSLLADLAAVDFGYITVGECLQRIDNTLASMEKLERYRGHFYNWYDTRTLAAAAPAVRVVGGQRQPGRQPAHPAGGTGRTQNPAGAVSARAARTAGHADGAGRAAARAPAPELAKKIALLQDSLHTLLQDSPPQTPEAASRALEKLQRIGGTLAESLPTETGVEDELYYWARAFDLQVRALRDELAALVPAPGRAAPCRPGWNWPAPATPAQAQLERIDALILRCRALAAMDFEFLYDAASGLLTIGYDVGERRRDPSCYDLLASEARLASFLLIAQGQLPQKHWFALGRLLTSHGGDVSLISWSGSMFEYLMPQLIMPSYENTLLEQTCKAAVARQIEYGRQRAVPWGISESCYNATDVNQVYQYRAFGVPGLGFKRGLGDDLVIAPYASALALMVMPREACRNLQTLADQGFSAPTASTRRSTTRPRAAARQAARHRAYVHGTPPGHEPAWPLRMCCSTSRCSAASCPTRWRGRPNCCCRSGCRRSGATLHPHAAEVSAAARPPSADVGSIMRVFTEPNTQLPEVHLLSNGRYHVMATHAGGSYSRWRDLAVTRWREDATTDSWGTFRLSARPRQRQVLVDRVSADPAPADHYEAIFVQARAEYRRRDQAIEAHTEISVSPEDDVEIRRVTLTNQSARSRRIEVTSYAEVVLAPLNADLAHRAFSNLFVQTEILPERQAILCTRRRARRASRCRGCSTCWPRRARRRRTELRDRPRPLHRTRPHGSQPAGARQPRPSPGAVEYRRPVLDPIVAIRRTVTLSPDESASVQIISGVADTREAALALLEKYCDRHFVERAFEMAWFQSQEVLRHLNATEADAQLFGRMANSVSTAMPCAAPAPGVIARNRLGQSGLWRFAISGDLPIVLLHIGDLNRIDLVKQVLQAHAYWRMKGLAADLVIVNEDFSGYRAELQDLIMGLINAGPKRRRSTSRAASSCGAPKS